MRKSLILPLIFFSFVVPGVYALDKPAPQAGNDGTVRTAIVNAAKRYLNAKYAYGAMEPPNKFDCSGLVCQAYLDALGILLPRSAAEIWSRGERINKNEPEPGDIIVFNTTGRGASHVAIYLDDRYMIHSASSGAPTGVIITSQSDRYWASRVMGYVTFVGDPLGAAGTKRSLY